MYRTILFLVVTSMSCSPSLMDVDDQGNALPKKIKKFHDGPVTCWIYEQHGISCLHDETK